jgi:hypothetical protein
MRLYSRNRDVSPRQRYEGERVPVDHHRSAGVTPRTGGRGRTTSRSDDGADWVMHRVLPPETARLVDVATAAWVP